MKPKKHLHPIDAFRAALKEGRKQGLVLRQDAWKRPAFYFDENAGPFRTPPNAKSIVQLLRIVKRIGHGYHISLLDMLADNKELESGKNRIGWRRSYHVSEIERVNMTSLADWLTEQGYGRSVKALLKD